MTGPERRIHPRVPVSWPVRLWIDETLILGRAIDVSEQGLCVITAPTDAIKRGDSYRVDVVVAAADPVSLTAEVRYVSEPVIGLRTRERLYLPIEPAVVTL